MIKTSLLVQQQLPSFVREDDNYQNFVAFIESYYEWLEQDSNVLSESKKIQEYIDIDSTVEKFVEYFYSTFMPAFPKDVITDKRKLLRFSKELYENKGNRAAYKFLFRCLYNVDSDVYETKEYVVKASAGKWFLPKSVKIKSNDSRWINAENLFIFGDISKSLAKIERAKVVNDRVEIFISDIQRLFQTGEFVKVVDVNLQNVYFDVEGNIVEEGEILEGKLLGTISSVDVNRNYRGNYYLSGDPVVFYEGLEEETSDIGAVAEVGEVTLGAIQRVKVEEGSYGYREHPNTFIFVTPDSGKPILTVGAINPANTSNVTMMVADSLELKENIPLNCNVFTGFPISNTLNYNFSRTLANSLICNANTVMANAFTFREFSTYSIDTVIVQNGGGGFRTIPTISAESMYETDLPFGMGDEYDPRYTPAANTVTSIKNFGILGPILIRTDSSGNRKRGVGYKVGDEILFSGGLGGGAFANVTSVLSGGEINTVSYYTSTNNPAPLGGFGYSNGELPYVYVKPTVTSASISSNNVLRVSSSFVTGNVLIGQTVSGNGIPVTTTVINSYSNGWVILSNSATGTYVSNTYSFVGTGADLYVSTVLGDGAKLVPITDRIGSITTIKITNFGEDYISAPKVSLKVQDIAVSNVSLLYVPQKGDIVYQGANSTSFTYKSYVDSINRITFDENSETSTYILRVYNYNKLPNPNTELTLQKTKIVEPNTYPISIKTDYVFPRKFLPDGTSQIVGKDGILTYGDGTAKANSKFLNGLILGSGRYIDESHQPSSFSVLEDENYNNFTYVVSVEKDISKYRDILYESMHPSGTKVIGQAVIKNEANSEIELKGSTYVNYIDDFEYIWAALATEEVAENEFNSELMRFPESISKYATLDSNNSNMLRLSSFPNISKDQKIYGVGIPWDTKIKSINIANSSIILTENATENQNGTLLLVMDDWSGSDNKYILPYQLIQCNTSNNSNVVVIRTSSSSNLTSDLIKNHIVVGNTTTIYANTVNNSNMLKGVESVSNIVIGQYITGNNIPSGTKVSQIISGNNTIVMTHNASANANGYSYSYFDKQTETIVGVYKYNYIQFQSVPYNTRISRIITANNTLLLSNNCIKTSIDDVYYFLGDGTSNRDSEIPSEFVRVESGQFTEKYGSIGGARKRPEENYFVFDDDLLSESGEPLLTENDVNISATIYIRIK
jgi:hypothetical protein